MRPPLMQPSLPRRDDFQSCAARDVQTDFHVRMQRFFDHYLKHETPPAWMTDGVPQLRKGREMRG